MDLTQITINYIERILSCTDGMKILVLDKETLKITSSIYRHSLLLDKEIYLTTILNSVFSDKNETLSFLNCIFFVRPTKENIQQISLELAQPQYSNYFIFFTGRIEATEIEYLARSDCLEKVMCIEECYVDYISISSFHYVFNTEHINDNNPVFQRILDGLLSFSFAFGKRQKILFSSGSSKCFSLANNLETLFDKNERMFKKEENSLLIILDRNFDLITPLITDWNYNAMLHELLGMNRGRIKDENNKEIALTGDSFYQKSLFCNFGEMGDKIKELVSSLKEKKDLFTNTSVEKELFFQFQKYLDSRTHTKSVQDHLSLFTKMEKKVEEQSLYLVSEIEQEIVSGIINTIEKLEERIKELERKNMKNKYFNVLSLFFLFALKYETHFNTKLSCLAEKEGINREDVKIILKLCQNIQKSSYQPLLSANTFKKIGKGLFIKEKETSIYLKHKPLLQNVFESIEQEKYSDYNLKQIRQSSTEHKTVFFNFFIVGGSTHAEGQWAEEYNKKSKKKISIGGVDLLTKKRFIETLRKI